MISDLNMINIKVPYIVYPIVLGLMTGWLVSVVIGNINVSPKPLPVPKVKSKQIARPTPEIIEKIINSNIFGLEARPAVLRDESGEVAVDSTGKEIQAPPPPPPFNAQLLGVLKSEDGLNGIAIITVDNGTISIRIGSEKDGLKLLSLEDFSAIIEKERKRYTLVLEQGESLVKKSAAGKVADKPATVQTGSNVNITLERESVQEELKDLNKILQSALVSPFYDAGNFLGYRVTRMREDSPLRKLGLMPGDTITRINGSELKSPELLFSMLSQIDDISAISIDMIRNNEKKTVFVEIQ